MEKASNSFIDNALVETSKEDVKKSTSNKQIQDSLVELSSSKTQLLGKNKFGKKITSLVKNKINGAEVFSPRGDLIDPIESPNENSKSGEDKIGPDAAPENSITNQDEQDSKSGLNSLLDNLSKPLQDKRLKKAQAILNPEQNPLTNFSDISQNEPPVPNILTPVQENTEIFSSTSPNSEIIELVNPGDILQVISNIGSNMKVLSPSGAEGFVDLSKVEFVENGGSPNQGPGNNVTNSKSSNKQDQELQNQESKNIVYPKSDNTEILGDTSIRSNEIAIVNRNTPLTVVGSVGPRYKILTPEGKTGYILKIRTTKSKPRDGIGISINNTGPSERSNISSIRG